MDLKLEFRNRGRKEDVNPVSITKHKEADINQTDSTTKTILNLPL